MPALEVEARPLRGLLPGRQPGTLAELVGDSLRGPAEVAGYLGPHPARLARDQAAQQLAGVLEGPSGAVGPRQVQVDADVDDHPGRADRLAAQHAQARARLGEPAELVGQTF